MADVRNRNILTYGITSVILQFFIAFMITMAQAGEFAGTNGEEIMENQFSIINDQTGNYQLYNSDSEINTGLGRDTVFDQVQAAIDTGGAITKLSIFIKSILNVGLLWTYAGSVGGILGIFLMLIVGFWQLQTGHIVASFIIQRLSKNA